MVLQENYETDIDVMLVNIGRKRLLKVFEVANSDHSNLKVGKHDHYCSGPAAGLAAALGVEPRLAFENPNASLAERSEGLVYRIADLLQKLKKLVPESGLRQDAIDDFSGRVLFPVLQQFHVG